MKLPEKLKKQRLALNLTLENLAERSGVSRAMLSDVERGLKSPTIKVLSQIAEGLQCNISELLDEQAIVTERLQILRQEERQVLVDTRSGVERHLLAPAFLQRGAEILWYLIPPGQSTGNFSPHRPGSAEHLTVAQGCLEGRIDGQEVRLEKGDSLFFYADTEHEFYNPGPEPCGYFLVIDHPR